MFAGIATFSGAGEPAEIHMLSDPKIVERKEQVYAAIAARVAMKDVASVADTLPGELFGWLAAREIAPAGVPFFRYNVIDMEHLLQLEWGVPISAAVSGDGRVLVGILPAGRYASLIHTGPFSGLMAATAALLKWVDESGLKLDMTRVPEGDRFACRLEIYLTDPRSEPDSKKWQTEIAMRLADAI
jgi:effector-binding domain-containing protein